MGGGGGTLPFFLKMRTYFLQFSFEFCSVLSIFIILYNIALQNTDSGVLQKSS